MNDPKESLRRYFVMSEEASRVQFTENLQKLLLKP